MRRIKPPKERRDELVHTFEHLFLQDPKLVYDKMLEVLTTVDMLGVLSEIKLDVRARRLQWPPPTDHAL